MKQDNNHTRTIHGYPDTEKLLTWEQWDSATTEQRQGFIDEGYRLINPEGYTSDILEREITAYQVREAELIEAVEKIAFEMKAPNPYTPRLILLCVGARNKAISARAALKRANGDRVTCRGSMPCTSQGYR